ncbi:MAG TPA: DUF2784 domain-containing protein [Casimicrobiaceae bacterium]|jgi:hypothetical protein|nr:DUF2784 domain-containing protein [Casimicrobiaceae bacterium]
MSERLAADAVLLLHLAFVLFVLFGGALVLRWPRLAWLHLPAVAWGVIVEATGWICPLTPLENTLRRSAGESGYAGDFVTHYVGVLLYPEDLTRGTQIVFALAVIGLNVFFYAVLLLRRRRRADRARQAASAAGTQR